jgi:uncharacterized protein (DUF3084 family)
MSPEEVQETIQENAAVRTELFAVRRAHKESQQALAQVTRTFIFEVPCVRGWISHISV